MVIELNRIQVFFLDLNRILIDALGESKYKIQVLQRSTTQLNNKRQYATKCQIRELREWPMAVQEMY